MYKMLLAKYKLNEMLWNVRMVLYFSTLHQYMVIFLMIQLISFCQTYEYFDNATLLLRNETHCAVISCCISHVYLGYIVLGYE